MPASRLKIGRDGLALAGLVAAAMALGVAAQRMARRGDLGASLVLALFALILGFYVVLRAWPNFLRPNPVYQFTRQGLLYVLSVFVVAVAALASGNNLLFLVLASMLGALLVSGLVSRLNLVELELQCAVPEHIYAGQEVPVRVRLRNLKSWMPSFAIWLRCEFPFSGPAAPPPDPQTEAYFPLIAGNSPAPAVLTLRFPRRGAYRQESFWLRSGFPFGFLLRSVRLRLPREILVYPSVAPTPELERSLEGLSGLWESRQIGLGQDLYRIRPYMSGDSARVIHWKASAHTGDLKVREFALEEDRRIEILFDAAVPPGEVWRQRFERGVEMCASLVWRLHITGASVRFQPGELESVYDMLRYLALVEPVEEGEPLAVIPSGLFQVVFTASAAGAGASLSESNRYCYYLEDL